MSILKNLTLATAQPVRANTAQPQPPTDGMGLALTRDRHRFALGLIGREKSVADGG